jgi:tRNA modification GTPase
VFSTSDTIVAIATPPGRGGIGIVRLSGSDACGIARRLINRSTPFKPRHATIAKVTTNEAGAGSTLDQVVVTYFPAPASYTGDDVVEIGAHGSPVILRSIVSAAMAAGARLAEPGEFTLRAFINGRIDLMQAEAVADLIDAVTPLQARTAFDQLNGTLTREISAVDAALFDLIARLEASVDFPEEGYHFIDPGSVRSAIDGVLRRTQALLASARTGRLVREGLQVAIVGATNVGKSSLFNALIGSARAIVTDIPGTTRDLVTETIDLDGLQVTLIDTAGARDTEDVIESAGVARSRQAARAADLVLLVADRSQPWADPADIFGSANIGRRLLVASKADLPAAWQKDQAIPVIAPMSVGLEKLRGAILAALDVDLQADRPGITNVRHITLVERAHESLLRARHAASADSQALSEEFVLADLNDARAALEEVTGTRTSDALLGHIFSRFCVGK